MAKYAIIPDSSCDLTRDLRERFGINDYLHGVMYFPDGRTMPADLDWGVITPDEYYNSMSSRSPLYKTAACPMGDIAATFEKHLAAGEDILSISLSSGLSSTYNDCLHVAKELMEKYPERKIICIDSHRYSTALALLVISACMKRDEGATIEENAAYLEEEKHRIHQMGIMDDLFFLVKTGRINNFKAFFGSLVGINLTADFNNNGICEVLGRFKGKRPALEAVVRYMEKTIVDPEEQIIFLAHSNRDAVVKTLEDMIRTRIRPKEIISGVVGMSCGASIGPGLCAAFYKGNPISKDLVVERAVMDEIAADLKSPKQTKERHES